MHHLSLWVLHAYGGGALRPVLWHPGEGVACRAGLCNRLHSTRVTCVTGTCVTGTCVTGTCVTGTCVTGFL
jgi:hypothetical protein